MAARTRYLLAYDIRQPRRLRRVHEVAKGYGDPLQYSIFVCDLTGVELFALRGDLLNEMDRSQDSVAIFDLGPPASRGVECIDSSVCGEAFPTADRRSGERGLGR